MEDTRIPQAAYVGGMPSATAHTAGVVQPPHGAVSPDGVVFDMGSVSSTYNGSLPATAGKGDVQVPLRNLGLAPGEVEVARYHQKMECDCDQWSSQQILLTTHRIAIESVTRLAPCIRAWSHEESFFYSDIQQVVVTRATKTGLLVASGTLLFLSIFFFGAAAASWLAVIGGIILLLASIALFFFWLWKITRDGFVLQLDIGREGYIASWNWHNRREPFAKHIRCIELDRDDAYECAYRLMSHPQCNLRKMFPGASP